MAPVTSPNQPGLLWIADFSGPKNGIGVSNLIGVSGWRITWCRHPPTCTVSGCNSMSRGVKSWQKGAGNRPTESESEGKWSGQQLEKNHRPSIDFHVNSGIHIIHIIHSILRSLWIVYAQSAWVASLGSLSSTSSHYPWRIHGAGISMVYIICYCNMTGVFVDGIHVTIYNSTNGSVMG